MSTSEVNGYGFQVHVIFNKYYLFYYSAFHAHGREPEEKGEDEEEIDFTEPEVALHALGFAQTPRGHPSVAVTSRSFMTATDRGTSSDYRESMPPSV